MIARRSGRLRSSPGRTWTRCAHNALTSSTKAMLALRRPL
jgi:hypothetical protein